LGRQTIKFTKAQLLVARTAFQRRDSCSRISAITGVSRRVWERELREHLGDEAFEAQMHENLTNPRSRKGLESPGEIRPAIRSRIKKIREEKNAAVLLLKPSPEEEERRQREFRVRQGQVRQGGKTTPVFCTTTSQAFGSLYAASKATGLPVHQIRRSVYDGYEIPGADGVRVTFRRWMKGDPPVSSRPLQRASPVRFEDGSSWPSAGALARELGASTSELGRFRRYLRQIGYGPAAPALPLKDMLLLAGQMPFLERERLERRIAAEG